MNFDDQFNKLVDIAAGECAPSVNVANKVIGMISSIKTEPAAVSERQMMWMAVCSSAAAVIIVALIPYYTAANATTEVLQVISWVIQ